MSSCPICRNAQWSYVTSLEACVSTIYETATFTRFFIDMHGRIDVVFLASNIAMMLCAGSSSRVRIRGPVHGLHILCSGQANAHSQHEEQCVLRPHPEWPHHRRFQWTWLLLLRAAVSDILIMPNTSSSIVSQNAFMFALVTQEYAITL